MNVPVPPLFVYESDLAKYEVMDGQQRISAILDFYSNLLQLQGLEQWPELNGRYYDTLPSEIRRGIDRRSISYIVLLKESAPSTDDEILLRQQVFERLNTGGIALSNQEVRNAIYQSDFSELLNYLSRSPLFCRIWNIPEGGPDELGRIPDDLAKNRLFSTMRDAEIVVRFFALRHVHNYRAGMKNFLDEYMLRARNFSSMDIEFLARLYQDTLELAYRLYGEHTFCTWDHYSDSWSHRPQVALADAVMVGCSRYVEYGGKLLDRHERVNSLTREALVNAPFGTFTGLKNTKADVQARIRLFDELLEKALS